MFKYLGVFFLSLGCVSWSSKDQNQIPEITAKTPMNERIALSIDYGGKAMDQSKKIMQDKGEFKEIQISLEQVISKNFESWSDRQLINAVEMYESTKPSDTTRLFELLSKSKEPIRIKLAWRLAGIGTSLKLPTSIDFVLTRDFDSIDRHLIGEMAQAVRIHRVETVYTILKMGLMKTGELPFAQALAALKPIDSTSIFLEYLNLAPTEELRQRTLAEVNSFTCAEILSHLEKYPAAPNTPGLKKIFEFAVSRNLILANRARAVIEAWVPMMPEVLSEELARSELFIQMAFIEGTRREPTRNITGLLERLKTTTTHAEVLDELANFRI